MLMVSRDQKIWSHEQKMRQNEYNWNNKDVYAIFMTIFLEEMKRVSICEMSKEA